MNEELDLLELFYAFWKKKIWFIIAVVLGAVLGFVYTEFIIVPKYTSSVTLILSKPTNATSSILDAGNEAAITQSDIQLNQKLNNICILNKRNIYTINNLFISHIKI